MVKRPLPDPVKIPAHMFRVELWPSQWIIGDHVKGKEANVSVALNVLTQHFDAVVCATVSPSLAQYPHTQEAACRSHLYVLGGLLALCRIPHQEVRNILCRSPAVKG